MTASTVPDAARPAPNLRNDAKSALRAVREWKGETTVSAPVRGRVVVSDDEPSARRGLVTLLRGAGFEVIEAEDGFKALQSVEKSGPDVLVADLHMRGLDGLELLRRARAACPDLIMVVAIAFADVETGVRAMLEGAEHYLTKPLQIDELLLVLDRALERRHLKNEATELRARLKEQLRFERLGGSRPAMQGVFNVVEQARGTVRIPGSSMAEIERYVILSTLEACHGRTGRAAQMLGISVRKIQYKLRDYGVSTERRVVHGDEPATAS